MVYYLSNTSDRVEIVIRSRSRDEQDDFETVLVNLQNFSDKKLPARNTHFEVLHNVTLGAQCRSYIYTRDKLVYGHEMGLRENTNAVVFSVVFLAYCLRVLFHSFFVIIIIFLSRKVS